MGAGGETWLEVEAESVAADAKGVDEVVVHPTRALHFGGGDGSKGEEIDLGAWSAVGLPAYACHSLRMHRRLVEVEAGAKAGEEASHRARGLDFFWGSSETRRSLDLAKKKR